MQRLAEAGVLARFHGGVRLPGSTTENLAYRRRQALRAEAKQRIARAVAANLHIAALMNTHPDCEVFVAGMRGRR